MNNILFNPVLFLSRIPWPTTTQPLQKAYCDLAGSQEVGKQQRVDGTWMIQNSWGGLSYITQNLDF